MAAAVASGEVSSRELVDLHLDRIDRLDGRLGAYVTVDADGARARADDLDRTRSGGDRCGPLHGVPISVKDCFATAGLRTTAGTRDLADHVPTADAVAVARLRGAGAVIVGKTNLPAGVSGQETANELAGRTVNPWEPSRTCGGSSGGAAAALAVGMAPLELGSDSGGSIRQPAHCCGVLGHVATHGTVAQRGHLPSVPVDDVGAVLDLFSVGPMARAAADLDLALQVLVAADALGPPAWRIDLPPPAVPNDDVTGVRVALVVDDPACPVSAEVRHQLQAAGTALESAGAVVVADAWAPFDVGAAMDVGFRLWVAANADDDDGSGGAGDLLSVSRADAAALTHGEWLELDATRRRLTRRWAALFDHVDVVVCPVSPVIAVRHDPDASAVDDVGHRLERTIDVDGRQRPYLDQIRWNVLVGLAGLPATAVPLGVGPSGLPVGAQVVGPPHADRTTIAFAGALTSLLGGVPEPPGWA